MDPEEIINAERMRCSGSRTAPASTAWDARTGRDCAAVVRTSRWQANNGGRMAVTTIAERDWARLPDDDLLLEYQLDRDRAVREELVKRFLPFARKLALR